MIQIDVEGYCQSCMDFSPDVIKPARMIDTLGTVIQSNTIIRCEHEKRCRSIKRYLEQQMKGEVSG